MSDCGCDCVKVAVRIRPLIVSETERGCQAVVRKVENEPQVTTKAKESFTFNYVFPPEETQEYIYETTMTELLDKLFQGFNVTVLAYGQTGSGKTHTMGTDFNGVMNEKAGIIPRAIVDIFNRIEDHSEEFIYSVSCSFVELYQELLYDLLSEKEREKSIVDIREDNNRGLFLQGLNEVVVKSSEETIEWLKRGSTGRKIGATAMNNFSSRSHAIFIINIHIKKKDDPNYETTSKFNLVDLAGSERAEKTKAIGERFKEGVKINMGLLALGNVINALGTKENPGYIGYRDSKLTRILRDSLGGNSLTLMIACVSPADYNLEETISTLRYADRAKRIKNKPIVNQDPKIEEINRLNKIVQDLRLRLLEKTCSKCGNNVCVIKETFKEIKNDRNEIIQSSNIVPITSHLSSKSSDITHGKVGPSNIIDENIPDVSCTKLLSSTHIKNENINLPYIAKEEIKSPDVDVNIKSSDITGEKENITFSFETSNLNNFDIIDSISNDINEFINSEDNSNPLYDLFEVMISNLREIKDWIASYHPLVSTEDPLYAAMDLKFSNVCKMFNKLINLLDVQTVDVRSSNSDNGDSDDDILLEPLPKEEVNHISKQVDFLDNLLKAKIKFKCKKILHQHDVELLMENLYISQDKISNDMLKTASKLKGLEEKKTCLEKQLTKLSPIVDSTVKSSSTKEKLAKIANDRRKQIQTLEKQIQELKKEIRLHEERLLKKNREVKKMNELKQQIINMKTEKVKTINNMKMEFMKFREWKAIRDKEVVQLKAQNRKKEAEIVKMETIHTKQKAVLKRKVEEALTVNKRLKEALEKQKSIRMQRKQQPNNNKTQQHISWFEGEVEVLLSTVDGKHILRQLMEERAEVNKKLDDLKEKSPHNVEEINSLEEDIQMRNAQISDLQEKVIQTPNFETGIKKLCENVHNLPDAKSSLKYVLEYLLELRQNVLDESEQTKLQYKINCENKEQFESAFKEMQEQYDKYCSELVMYYENKLSLLKNDLLKRDKDTTHNEQQKPKSLEEQLMRNTIKKKNMSKTEKQQEVTRTEHYDSFHDSLDESPDLDNTITDPDWKQTPISRRHIPNESKCRKAIKRSSDTIIRCECKRRCRTKRCRCRKNNSICSENCSCSAGCVNKIKGETNSDDDKSGTLSIKDQSEYSMESRESSSLSTTVSTTSNKIDSSTNTISNGSGSCCHDQTFMISDGKENVNKAEGGAHSTNDEVIFTTPYPYLKKKRKPFHEQY